MPPISEILHAARCAARDLILGATCLGCQRVGETWCAACAASVPVQARLAWPTPTPPGLVRPFAVTPYDGPVRHLIVAFKESQARAALGPLAQMLASSVRALGTSECTVLVPVPSRAASVRSRGLDATWLLTQTTAAVLTLEGRTTVAWRGVRVRPDVRDQAGLSATERAANLSHTMSVSAAALRRLSARVGEARIVVCDDILTTGASAREAQRALAAVGLKAAGVAVVAATQRRALPRTGGLPEDFGHESSADGSRTWPGGLTSTHGVRSGP